MLRPHWLPTPLLAPAERAPVQISEGSRQVRFPAFQVFILFGAFTLRSIGLRILGRETLNDRATRVREVFEALGGLWIKIGQLLSLRTDIFSAEVCRELSRLQNRALGFPIEEVRQILRREWGHELEDVFSTFEEAPLAAASISQVHRAVLRGKDAEVVVKVLRPNAEVDFMRDLANLKRVIAAIEWLGLMPHVHWSDAIWELERMVREEIDFRFEAANTKRMRKTLREHEVYVPKVFGDLCTRHVLVTEFVGGVLMSDFIQVLKHDPRRLDAWCLDNGIRPSKLGKRIFASTLRQFMEDNQFHADLHPGNILLLRRNRYALIDFGTIGRSEKEFMANYKASLMALAELDFGAAADLTLRMAIKPPHPEVYPQLRFELIQSYRDWESRTALSGTGYHQRSLASAGNDSGRIMYRYKVQLTWAFMRLSRTWTTLDSSLNFLVPDANYLKLFQSYFTQAQKRRLAPRKLLQGVLSSGVKALRTVDQYNAMIGPMLRRQALLAGTFGSFSDKAARAMGSILRGAKFLGGTAAIILLLVMEELFFPDLIPWDIAAVKTIARDFEWMRFEYLGLGTVGVLVTVFALRRAARTLDRS